MSGGIFVATSSFGTFSFGTSSVLTSAEVCVSNVGCITSPRALFQEIILNHKDKRGLLKIKIVKGSFNHLGVVARQMNVSSNPSSGEPVLRMLCVTNSKDDLVNILTHFNPSL